MMPTRLHLLFDSLASTANYLQRRADERVQGVEVCCLGFRAGGQAGGRAKCGFFFEVTRASGQAGDVSNFCRCNFVV